MISRSSPEPSASRDARLIAWIVLVALLLPGQMLWVWLLRGNRLIERESLLIWGQALLGCGAIGMFGLLKSTPADAIKLPRRAGVAIVLGGTLLLQAGALLLLAPSLSDDLLRYRIDGRTWLSGESPYATPPGDLLKVHPGDAADERVPYRDWRTIYPPVSEAVFAVVRWVDDYLVGGNANPSSVLGDWRVDINDPALRRHTLVFRAAFGLFAIAAVALLLCVLHRAGESPWWAAVLGWNPLITLECAGMGHQDAIGVFLLALTVYAAQSRRFRSAAVALAAAVGVKLIAIFLLPLLWRRAHEQLSFRAGRRMLLVFVISLAVIFLPPLLWRHGWIGWRESLGHFGRSWEANGFLYEGFKRWFGQGDAGRQMERAKDAARLLALLAGLAMGLFLWQARARLVEAGYWLFMVLLLCAPVAYPWYLMWALAFVPLLRGPQGYAALVWAATMGMSYTIWRQPQWAVPSIWLAAEQVPVLGVLGIELLCLARVRPMGRVTIGETHLNRAAELDAYREQAQRTPGI